MTIMAMMGGHYGYRPTERFIRDNADDLRQLLDWPRRAMPSNVTLRAVLQAIDFGALSAAFRAWAAERLPEGEVLAVDAEAIRSTVSDHDCARQDFVALVSAYGVRSGTVAGAVRYRHEQTSEVAAAQDLIADLAGALDLRGTTVTLDALHAVKKTLRDIHGAGGDWLVKLKRNRHALHAACAAVVERGPVLDLDETTERTRGRFARRRVEVYAAPTDVAEGWPPLGRELRVVRSGDGAAYRREGLYLTSRTGSAATLAAIVRAHWHVENRLHWCKDVLQNEGAGGVRSKAGAAIRSALRGASLSVLRHNGEWSPTAARSRLANRVGAMLDLLRT